MSEFRERLSVVERCWLEPGWEGEVYDTEESEPRGIKAFDMFGFKFGGEIESECVWR